MDGQNYSGFNSSERDLYQIDYRTIVGEMELTRPTRDPLPPGMGSLSGYHHGHGHETAAQRYTATRIQAGFEPER